MFGKEQIEVQNIEMSCEPVDSSKESQENNNNFRTRRCQRTSQRTDWTWILKN